MATTALNAMREYDLTEEDFRFLARQVYDLTGIVIHERKRDMLYSRLSRRLRIAEPVELPPTIATMSAGPMGPPRSTP